MLRQVYSHINSNGDKMQTKVHADVITHSTITLIIQFQLHKLLTDIHKQKWTCATSKQLPHFQIAQKMNNTHTWQSDTFFCTFQSFTETSVKIRICIISETQNVTQF